MSANPAKHAPGLSMMAKPADGHGGGGMSGRGARPDEQAPDPGETASPPPLPADPRVRAQILASIERGLAQARAGIGDDLEDVLADMDRKIAASR
ncbi:MAG: hypothetical protein U1A78_03625 [Polyangia bacterium]